MPGHVFGQEKTPIYAVRDIGTLGGSSSVGRGLNSLGWVVGSADTVEGRRHAFVWRDGIMSDIHFPSTASISECADVNDPGQVVCIFGIVGGSYLWENGQFTTIGFVEVLAINNLGQVVGSMPPNDGFAFLWQNGTFTDLGSLGGADPGSTAIDINDLSQIVGSTSSPEGARAFLWENGVMMSLGTIPGVPHSLAFGINGEAQVVGRLVHEGPSSPRSAFFWQNGMMSDIQDLTGTALALEQATRINNVGQAVGTQQSLVDGFLYDSNTQRVYDLRDLVSPESEWSFLVSLDINDRGQITGYGAIHGDLHAMLMSPAGACCERSTGLCMDYVAEDDCQLLNHIYTANEFCENLSCIADRGACCDRLDGTCVAGIYQNDCFATAAHPEWTLDAQCMDVFCEPALGACCDSRPGSSGSCLDAERAACPLAQHVTWTIDLACADADCNEISGACCDALTGGCFEDRLLEACSGENQTWTPASTCSEVTCPLASGACWNHGADGPTAASCTESTFPECDCPKCEWTKGADCAGIECEPKFPPIPTTTTWGLVLLGLILITSAKVRSIRRVISA